MLALIAAVLAGGRPETVVAVTGTNGKTSTVDFLRQIWTLAGHRAASIGTLGLVAPGHDPGPGLTTPDPVTLAELLSGLARDGVQHVAMEASSHGLDQFRLDGVRLAAAGFTNLTRDHLDYHVTMAGYRAAKLRLVGALLPPRSPCVAHSDMDPVTLEALRAGRHRPASGISLRGADGLAVPPGRGDAVPRWPNTDSGRSSARRAEILRTRNMKFDCNCPAGSRPITCSWPPVSLTCWAWTQCLTSFRD